MERHQVARQGVAILVSVILAYPRPAPATPLLPEDFTVEGRLFDDQGAPVNANVDFKLEVVDDAGTCVLYRESRTGVDLSSADATAQGVFALRLGAGTKEYGTLPFTQLFSPGAVTGENNCTAAALDASTHRKVRVSIKLSASTGGFETLSPYTDITSTPLAKVAENALTLEGLGTSTFLQVNGTSSLSQANAEYAFNVTNWPRLKALLDGDSNGYLAQKSTTAYDMNGQRVTDVSDPTGPQDVATKHYADGSVAGYAVDLTAVGPSLGAGSTLLWDATANKWVAGAVSASPTGAAGGDLAGTYPNPTIKNDAITAAKIKSAGVAVNRLILTDATTGANLGYGECTTNGQVYAWTATGWACTSVTTLAPVTSVAGKTGVVTLNANDVGGLGTAAVQSVGSAAGQIPRLDDSARLPAVDGSLLTNVNAVRLQSRALASTAPTAGQVLGWNTATSQWQPQTLAATGVTQIATGTGLLGGPISTMGTLSVDVGTAANKVVQENSSAQIAQAAGSAGLPSYAFAANANTGVFSPGAGQLALTANGTTGLTLMANGYVGIGTNAPGTRLTIYESAKNGGITPLTIAASPGLGAGKYVSLDIDNQTSGSFKAGVEFLNNGVKKMSLVTDYQGAGAQNFSVYDNVALATRLIIDPLGRVGLGTESPAAALDVALTGTGASAIILPRDTTSNRPAGANGMIRYNSTLKAFEGFQNGGWATIAAGAGVGTVTSLGTGTGLLGGPVTTTGTLAVDAGTAANKIVQENANAQIAQANGSANLPTYSFAASPNTGLFTPGTGSLALATNGSTRLSIDNTGRVAVGGDVTLSGALQLPYVKMAANAPIFGVDYLDLNATEANAGAAIAINSGGNYTSLALFNNVTHDFTNYAFVTLAGSDLNIGTRGITNDLNLQTNGTSRITIAPKGAVTFSGPVLQTPDTNQTASPLDFSGTNIVQTQVGCGSHLPQLNNLASGGTYTVLITDSGTSATAACDFSSDNPNLAFKYLPPNDLRVPGTTSIYNILVVGQTAYVTWVSGFPK